MQDRLTQFQQLVETDPADELSWYGLGAEYLKAGRFGEAARAFRKVLELDAGHSAAYRHLGYALMHAGDVSGARSAFHAGIPIAEAKGDLQTVKEMRVLRAKLEKQEEAE